PTGAAAVWLRDTSSRSLEGTIADGEGTVSRRRMALVVDPKAPDGGEAHRDYGVAAQQLPTAASKVQPVALSRGDEATAAVPVMPGPEGITVVHLRPEPEDPRITVRGQAKQSGSMIFILDCSYSMTKLVGVGNERSTRLNVARDALLTILKDI